MRVAPCFPRFPQQGQPIKALQRKALSCMTAFGFLVSPYQAMPNIKWLMLLGAGIARKPYNVVFIAVLSLEPNRIVLPVFPQFPMFASNQFREKHGLGVKIERDSSVLPHCFPRFPLVSL